MQVIHPELKSAGTPGEGREAGSQFFIHSLRILRLLQQALVLYYSHHL